MNAAKWARFASSKARTAAAWPACSCCNSGTARLYPDGALRPSEFPRGRLAGGQTAHTLDGAGEHGGAGRVRNQHGAAAADPDRGAVLGGKVTFASCHHQYAVALRQMTAHPRVHAFGHEE